MPIKEYVESTSTMESLNSDIFNILNDGKSTSKMLYP